MRFKIRDIGDDGLTIQEPVTAAWLAAECPDLGAKPTPGGIKVAGRLEKSGGESYLLRAHLKGSLQATCSRCLELANIPLSIPLTISFVEKDVGALDDEDAGDEHIQPITDRTIDLGVAIRDEILLAMPISPLCKDDCVGICPLCGGNRNANPCDCVERQKQAQSKFNVLSKLNQKD